MTEAKHILSDFDAALATLHRDVLRMAELTGHSLEHALSGLQERNDDLCLKTIADDDEINQLEKQIDRDGMELIIRFQPVAGDLRRVIATMKLSPNLERIADESVSIARKVRKLNRHPKLEAVQLLQPMGEYASEMFRDSVGAFLENDESRGRSLKERDKSLDLMNRETARELLARAAQDQEQLRGYLNLLFIATSLERVGDHATNIGEDVVYAVAAEDIRHQPFLPPAT
jgi:phosphate transport system protein